MRASTRGISLIKGRQLSETRKLLVSAGFRSRDAIVVFTFFKLVTPLIFLAGAALYVYGTDPIGKGPMLDAAAVIGAALVGSMLPDFVVKNIRKKRLESIRKALPELARHAGDLRRGRPRLRRRAEARRRRDRPQRLGRSARSCSRPRSNSASCRSAVRRSRTSPSARRCRRSTPSPTP